MTPETALPTKLIQRTRERGFSLLEVSIGLVILSLAAVGLVATLSEQTQQARIVETRAALQSAREATLAFITANGRLPCPATNTSNGQEAVASVVAGVTTCSTETGMLPAVTLGLDGLDTNGLRNDAWEDGARAAGDPFLRSLRYGITQTGPGVYANALTSVSLGNPTDATRRQAVHNEITNLGMGVFVCRSAVGISTALDRCGGAANTLSSNAAAVFFSRGINGNQPTEYSADELQNVRQTVPRVYITRDMVPEGAQSFDDMLLWISYPTMAARLLQVGLVQ
jgi:prepilin-type N-terminal cleavage/methylation domain-containing protein